MTNKYVFDIDIKRPIPKHITVCNGDEGVQFEAHITDNGEPVALHLSNNDVIAVFIRSDGFVTTLDEDGDDDLEFDVSGVVTINVRPHCFHVGTNTLVLQIYEDVDGHRVLKATTCERRFYARPAPPDASGFDPDEA